MSVAHPHGRATTAYLVLAHTAPRQLARLVEALDAPSAAIFVHLDADSDAAMFAEAFGASVHPTRTRISVRWGDFSQVEAILTLLRESLADPRRFERFVLISGVDHPLRSASGLQRFFDAHPDRQFINLVRMPDDAAGKPMARLTTYQFRPRHTNPGRLLFKALMAVSRRVHRRDVDAALGDLVPYGGSTWWAVTRDAAEWIITFPDREPRAARFFRRVICPDESYFPTIIGNSPFRDRTEPNLSFTDWSIGGANPAQLGDEHIATLAAHMSSDGPGRKLFARKFRDADGDLVERLARLTAEVESTPAQDVRS